MGDDEELADRLIGWDAVGRCYDALTVDPIDITHGAKYPMAFAFSEFDNTTDGKASKPVEVDYLTWTAGSYDRKVTEISSSYDFQTFMKTGGAVTVSDPTGDLFSGSLSASYQQTHKDTSQRNSVVTYATALVSLYKLRVRPGATTLRLSDDLAATIASLPVDRSPAYQAVIDRFGTHVAQEVRFGGRATQRIVVKRVDFESFLEQGVDVTADISATFEIAKAGAKAHVEDKRSKQFTSSSGVSVDSISYAGGYYQESFDMWAMNVKEMPAPVEVVLSPLSDLLTSALCPGDDAIATKQSLLEEAVNAYLTRQGTDPGVARLRPEEPVHLALTSPGPSRFLSTRAEGFATTVTAPDGSPPSGTTWDLVVIGAASPPSCVTNGQTVALRVHGETRFLDAQRGSDTVYDPGDGLTAATAPSATAPTTQWTVQLVQAVARDELVDGDYVRLLSRWRRPDEDRPGYLLAEADARDPAQRVYAFGAAQQPATIWRVLRDAT